MLLLRISSTSGVQQSSQSLSFNKLIIQCRDLVISAPFHVIGRSLLLVSVWKLVMVQRVSLRFRHPFLTIQESLYPDRYVGMDLFHAIGPTVLQYCA